MKILLLFATAMVAIAPASLAQSLPAGVQGYWKVTTIRPNHPVPTPGCNSNPAFSSSMAKKSRVLLSDRAATWGGVSASDLAPTVTVMDASDFASQYLRGGATLKEMGFTPSAKIEVIHLGAPGTLPFDTIVVKGPSTLLFEQCSVFTEAVHDGGFIAPPLPNSDQQ